MKSAKTLAIGRERDARSKNSTKKPKDKQKEQQLILSDWISVKLVGEDEIEYFHQAPSLPVLVEIQHEGFWTTNSDGHHVAVADVACSNNSIMLTNNCLLYVYKLALRHLLLSAQVIVPSEIDPANLVPHIRVRKDPKDAFSSYAKMQGMKFVINEDKLSAKSDFLTIEIDPHRDLHCTLIYAKKIGKRIDLVYAFKLVLRLLNTRPDMIKQYQNLDYFGEKCAEYWYNSGHSYPSNLLVPADFVSEIPVENFDHLETTAAGSIIGIKK